ncbi:O-linked N-acetylglucosamine transferase, SPINDLY family protein [Caballeronia glebae]|uniref:O-linked N-acetylglucosamine transferase, SPINDLY family protein n=1 Tax=Caballeronia glebae TaxID=1777143 RepID=UPI0038BB416A
MENDKRKVFQQSLERQIELDLRYRCGLELQQHGRTREAVSFYDDALACTSDPLIIAYLLGYRAQALCSIGFLDESLQNSEHALRLDPSQISAQCPMAYALLMQRRFKDCIRFCDEALIHHPERPELLHNRTAALDSLMRYEEALTTAERILQVDCNNVRALRNSGLMLHRLGRCAEAVDRYEHAASIDPDDPWLLGMLLTVRLRPFDWNGLDGLLHMIAASIDDEKPVVEPLNYLPACDDPQQQLRAAKIYATARVAAAREQRDLGHAQSRERIRVGYFSSEFRTHPVMELLAEVLELHDRDQFEIHGFSFVDDPDDPAQTRARCAFDHFHNVEGMLTEDVILLARRVGLDIAVDLNGHTQGARTDVFSIRVAPVQINFLGFPGTMGTQGIDYIIADPVVIPPELRDWYSEKVISVPASFQPNDRTRIRPHQPLSRTDYGLPEDGFIFCCFNSPEKLLLSVFDRWARILGAVDGSVLWIYGGSEEQARRNLLSEAKYRGLDVSRIVFAEYLPLQSHLARYCRADLFLDTYPFNAGATASGSLWCGLPVLTVSGKTFASRYGASLLTALGLPELIAPDFDAYQTMAIDRAFTG